MAKRKEKWRIFARELGRNRQLSWEPGRRRKEFSKILMRYKHLQQKEFIDLRREASSMASKQKVPYKMLLVGVAALVRECFRGRSMLILRDPGQIRQTVNAVAEALAEKTSSDRSSPQWFQMDQVAMCNILWILLLLYPIAQQKWWKKNKEKNPVAA